jgi:hypothetical protein
VIGLREMIAAHAQKLFTKSAILDVEKRQAEVAKKRKLNRNKRYKFLFCFVSFIKI